MLFHRRVKKPILSGRWLGRRAPNLPHEQRGKPQIPAAFSSEPANKSTDTANETHIGDESVFSLIFVLFFLQSRLQSDLATTSMFQHRASALPRYNRHVVRPCQRRFSSNLILSVFFIPLHSSMSIHIATRDFDQLSTSACTDGRYTLPSFCNQTLALLRRV